jgi:hypothetical protein
MSFARLSLVLCLVFPPCGIFCLSSIKIDLKRLFVTVIDHTTGPDHQLLLFKQRFLPKDHHDRAKMARFAAKLRKLGIREGTICYGPTKEQWESYNRVSQ